jgi:glutathione S-transferase
MVPCLRIESEEGEVKWMYESMDIMGYLADKHPE